MSDSPNDIPASLQKQGHSKPWPARPALRSNKGGLSALITDALRSLEGVVFASRNQIAAEMGVFKVWGPENGLYIHVLEMEGSSIDIGCLIEQIVLACRSTSDTTFLDTAVPC